MANGLSKGWWSASHSGGRMGLVCALLATMVTSLGSQELTVLTVLKSSLHWVPAGHALLLTVVETGSTTASSEVKIEFRDGADQRRGFVSAQLKRGRPVRLRVTATSARQLRAIVQITPLIDGLRSEPIVGLEGLDADSLTIETKPPCAPPPSVGSGAQGDCDGWRVNRFTLDQLNPANTADID